MYQQSPSSFTGRWVIFYRNFPNEASDGNSSLQQASIQTGLNNGQGGNGAGLMLWSLSSAAEKWNSLGRISQQKETRLLAAVLRQQMRFSCSLHLPPRELSCYRGRQKRIPRFCGFATALAHHFFLAQLAKFSQPGSHSLATSVGNL